MKKSKILKSAKTFLANTKHDLLYSKQHYICFCINDAWSGNNFAEIEELQYWIYDLLGGHRCYESWLRENHRILYEHIRITDPYFLEARHAWIDWMISHWESKGE